MSDPTVIGSSESIDLPEYGVKAVPAKIDTGADSCSIWATDIIAKEHTIEFKLFGPNSVFYTGDTITLPSYRTTIIKNSFGHQQTRYKVQLKISVGASTSKVWFSLADRSKNSFALLLGKNFLKDKYLVDASRNNLHGGKNQAKTLRIAVFSSKPDDELKRMFGKVASYNKAKVDYDLINYTDLTFQLSQNSAKVLDATTAQDISNTALAYFKSHRRYAEVAKAVAAYLSYHGIRFFDREILDQLSYNKLTQFMQLALNGLPIADTTVVNAATLRSRSAQIIKDFKFPLVVKDIDADRGRDNYLVEDERTLSELLPKLGADQWLAVQEFIPNDGYYRVFVFGRRTPLIVYRDTFVHTDLLKRHLNNPVGSVNASSKPADDVPPKVLELAIKASDALNRQIAGVDIIQDKSTKKWYILEVNAAPQLKSGSFLEEKAKALAQFIDREVKR